MKLRPKRSYNSIKYIKFPTFFRWGFLVALAFTVSLFLEFHNLEIVESGTPPLIYSNQCHDNLRKVTVNAILSAKKSIFLVIFGLSDPFVIDVLNQQASNHIDITLYFDEKASIESVLQMSDKIKKYPVRHSGLMHKKILSIDHERIYLGSTNFTTDSFSLHDNLILAFENKAFAQVIENNQPFFKDYIGGQLVEFWSFPEKGKEGLNYLIHLIDNAKSSIKIAMFTWTHPHLTEAIINAYERGVDIQMVLDRGQALGVGINNIKNLKAAKLQARINTSMGLCHHKYILIDDQIFISGSANWTKAAFSKNNDCFFILYDITEKQRDKIKKMWNSSRFQSKLYSLNCKDLILNTCHAQVFVQKMQKFLHSYDSKKVKNFLFPGKPIVGVLILKEL